MIILHLFPLSKHFIWDTKPFVHAFASQPKHIVGVAFSSHVNLQFHNYYTSSEIICNYVNGFNTNTLSLKQWTTTVTIKMHNDSAKDSYINKINNRYKYILNSIA